MFRTLYALLMPLINAVCDAIRNGDDMPWQARYILVLLVLGGGFAVILLLILR
jgi:hypothetical protein